MKKNVWIAILAASILAVSAVSLAGCGSSEAPETGSAAVSSAPSSQPEEAPSAPAAESSAAADSSAAAAPVDSGFEAVFAENPLDAGYEAMKETASTTQEIVSAASTFSGLWSDEIANAYSQLLAAPDSDKAAIEADQKSWNDNLSDELSRIRQSVSGDGSTVKMERAFLIMEFYRDKAKSLYAQLYQVNPDYTYAYAPY